MGDAQWKRFFEICATHLGEGSSSINQTNSWCSWTTFSRLSSDAGYWQSGLPRNEDIDESHIKDGGVWGQPFPYADIAHVIVPKSFFSDLTLISKSQDLNGLALALKQAGIAFAQTDLVLEIKLY